MKNVSVYDNKTLTDLLIDEFILGRKENFTQEHEGLIQSINDIVKKASKFKIGFKHWSRQHCDNLVTSMSFRGIVKTWQTKGHWLWDLGRENFPYSLNVT